MADPIECTDFLKHCRKIVGVAKNFKGEDPNSYPAEPIIFLKVPTTLVKEGNPIRIPEGFGVINYEVELGVIIGKECSNISEDEVLDHIGGYCLTLDMTAMDTIKRSREKGLPWLNGKSWDTFTPVSDFITKDSITDPHNVSLWLSLDGDVKQSGNTTDLYFDIKKVVSHTSKIMKLEKGDLFLTGTPLNAGPCKAGQVIKCGITGVKEMTFNVE